MVLTLFTKENADSSTQVSTESEKKATPGSIARKEKGGAREIKADNEKEVTTKRRSSRLENVLKVKVNDVLDLSSKCMDVPEEGPNFLDNG